MSLRVAATVATGDADADLLLRRADRALYRAKAEGRDRVCVADRAAAQQAVRETRRLLRAYHSGTFAVVCESGSGKSTAARVITGLLPPLDGRIVYRGETLPPDCRGRSRDEIFTPPHHACTELLLSSVPEMDPDWLDRVLERRGEELRDRGI